MFARIGALYRAAPEAPRNQWERRVMTERPCIVCGRVFLAYTATMCGGSCRETRERRRRGVPVRKRVAA
jgi:predicted nucleic acid-binding Zn ribbon protein